MTLIESVREHLRTCPLLSGDRLNVDFLDDEAGSYSVDVAPCKEVVRQYVNGSSQRQFLFVISSRKAYGENIRQNLDNLGFFETLGRWLKGGGLPTLDQGRTTQRLEVITSGYAFGPGENTARYQMQCKLLYFQEG